MRKVNIGTSRFGDVISLTKSHDSDFERVYACAQVTKTAEPKLQVINVTETEIQATDRHILICAAVSSVYNPGVYSVSKCTKREVLLLGGLPEDDPRKLFPDVDVVLPEIMPEKGNTCTGVIRKDSSDAVFFGRVIKRMHRYRTLNWKYFELLPEGSWTARIKRRDTPVLFVSDDSVYTVAIATIRMG